ncbi:MAG: VanZ family protein [Tenuifilaceae bacterium]|jgi:VanZ family protein|nr:VanZ family protein [Tenuifilaceae bacterium]
MSLVKHWKSTAWTVIILLATTLPSSSIPKTSLLNIPHFDKIVHFVLFFVLAILLISEFNTLRKEGELTRMSAVIALAVSVVYGLIIELLQLYFLTTRSGSLYDFAANVMGAIVAVLLYKTINRISAKRL